MTALSFQRLGPEHLHPLMAIERASFTSPWSEEAYAGELGANNSRNGGLSHYFGAFADGVLVAFVGFWQVLDEAHITNIAVAPDWRGQGLGRWLLIRALTVASSLGCELTTLEVRAANLPARRLYAGLGFTVEGRRRDYYQDPADDALIMWRSLSALPAAEKEDQP